MDRGFLFGDGVYEVIPSYDGKLVGFRPHLERLQNGLNAIEIDLQLDHKQWGDIASQLMTRNGGGNLALYMHISRGADTKRHHAYPTGIAPTIFAFAYQIPPPPTADKSTADKFTVVTAEDLRWQRCNIKSISLLGNVIHYQQSHAGGHNETILYNQNEELTEASSCNVYVVKNGVVATPQLDGQKLPGITRSMLLETLRRHGNIPVEERVVTLDELRGADEVWLSSSSRDVVPVVEIDGVPVADGDIGDMWLAAQTLYSAHKFDF